MEMNYVYLYRLEGKPIYVGIGTEDDGRFLRAKNFKAHKEIKPEEYKKIDIEVVGRMLSRQEARRIETTTLEILSRTNTMRNLRVSCSTTSKSIISLTAAAPPSIKQKTRNVELNPAAARMLKDPVFRKKYKNSVIKEWKDAEFFNHVIYLTPKIDKESIELQKVLIPGYDPIVDDLLEQLSAWARVNSVSLQDHAVMVFVRKEEWAKPMQEALLKAYSSVPERYLKIPPFTAASLELALTIKLGTRSHVAMSTFSSKL